MKHIYKCPSGNDNNSISHFLAVEPWKNRLTASEKGLTIKDFQRNFFGTFVCEVKSGLRIISKTEYKVFKYNGKNQNNKHDQCRHFTIMMPFRLKSYFTQYK